MISYIEVYKIGAKTKTSVFQHHFAKLWKTKNNTITMKNIISQIQPPASHAKIN